MSVTALADNVGLSRAHFSRLFKRSVGMAPVAYRMHCRLQKAHALIVGTNLPLGRIAAELGFSDQSHLTRRMKHAFGIAPKVIRRQGPRHLDKKTWRGARRSTAPNAADGPDLE